MPLKEISDGQIVEKLASFLVRVHPDQYQAALAQILELSQVRAGRPWPLRSPHDLGLIHWSDLFITFGPTSSGTPAPSDGHIHPSIVEILLSDGDAEINTNWGCADCMMALPYRLPDGFYHASECPYCGSEYKSLTLNEQRASLG